MLDVPRPPDKGDYFISLEKYLAERFGEKDAEAVNKFVESGSWRPWSKRDFPALDEWLAANEKPLALLIEASRRPRRYDPAIVPDDQSMIAVLSPALQFRNIAIALVAHAMLRANEGRIDAACDDLLALHRLARLVDQGPWLIDGLVALAIDGIACAGDQALLQHVRLSSETAMKVLADLSKLPPLFMAADKINIGERYMAAGRRGDGRERDSAQWQALPASTSRASLRR